MLRSWWIGLVATACGPDTANDAEDVWPRNCGQDGPVDLLEVPPLVASVRPVGEHLLVLAMRLDPATQDSEPSSGAWENRVVPRCGGDSVVLERGAFDETGFGGFSSSVGVAGESLVSCDPSTQRVSLLDPSGERPPQGLFEQALGCRLIPVADGLAAIDTPGGRLSFVEHPNDGEIERVTLLDDVVVDPDANASVPELDESPPRWELGPLAADYRLLVPMQDGRLLELDSRTGGTTTLADHGISELELLPGDRHVWLLDGERRPFWIHRERVQSTAIASLGMGPPVDPAGRWLVSASQYPAINPTPPEGDWRVLDAINLHTGKRYTVDGRDGWSVVISASGEALLVDIHFAEDAGRDGRYAYRPATGELEAIDFPEAGRDTAYAYRGGLLAFARDADTERGSLRRLADDARTFEPVLERVPSNFLVLADDRIAFVDRAEPDGAGPLRVHVPERGLVTLDEDVVDVLWPRGGNNYDRAFDTNEIVYAVERGDGWLLRRTVLP
jgi:hypothetical protein